MPSITIDLLDSEFEVEYDFKITARSSAGNYWDPPEPCEFEVELIELHKAKAKEPLEVPKWLEELLLEWLYESDEVYEAVAESEAEGPDYSPDER